MQTYTDGRLLFLSDAKPGPMEQTQVPVIDGWCWNISGTGQGYLESPDGQKHCQFDLLKSTLSFEPQGEPFSAPGLSPSVIQEMGEKYACELAFSESEKNAYLEHVTIRNNTQKVHDRGVYNQLKGLIQIEHRDGRALAHVDTDKVSQLTGIESEHIVSADDGYALFGRMCEKLHAKPLRDPSGYMALKGNMYEFIRTEYENQYENILQAIDNQMVDSTGYGVLHILDTLQSRIRHDVKEYLPEGETFGDLRFIEATQERKDAVKNFVKCRVSKTLTYEKKRSYEQSAIDKTNAKYVEAGNRLKDVLSSASYQAVPSV